MRFSDKYNVRDYMKSEIGTKESMEEAEKLYSQFFMELSSQIDNYKYQTEISRILLGKRMRVNSTLEYMDGLIKNIIFFVELEKEYLQLLSHFFIKKEIFSKEKLDLIITEIREVKLNQLEDLFEDYKNVYKKKCNTNRDLIEVLEFDYSFYSLLNDWLLSTVYNVSLDFDLANEFVKIPSEKSIDIVKRQLHWQIHIKLENVPFETREKSMKY